MRIRYSISGPLFIGSRMIEYFSMNCECSAHLFGDIRKEKHGLTNRGNDLGLDDLPGIRLG